MCFKPVSGTWAPSFPGLQLTPAVTGTCSFRLPYSVDNNFGPASGRRVSLRAHQYIQSSVAGSTSFASLSSSLDAVKFVPQSSKCYDNTVAYYSTPSVPSSVDDGAAFVAYAPTNGSWKACFRYANRLLFSPICSNVSVAPANPIGASFKGCFSAGQTWTIVLNYSSASLAVFNASSSDAFRVVSGDDQCDYVDSNLKTVASGVLVNGSEQTSALGTALDVSMVSGRSAMLLPITLESTAPPTLKLCYRDSNNTEFAIPLLASRGQLNQTVFAIAPRNPTSSTIFPSRAQLGQLLLMNFTQAPSPALLYANGTSVPDPWFQLPLYSGLFDASGAAEMTLFENSNYVEGICARHLQTSSVALHNVFNSSTSTTLGNAIVFEAYQQYMPCYQPANCSVEDVPNPFVVYGYNPSSTSILQPPAPRRGQLVTMSFSKNMNEADALQLSPGLDRAALSDSVASCWELPSAGGNIVTSGSVDVSSTAMIVYAQPPSISNNSTVRVCYELSGATWSEIPNNTFTMLPANPTQYTTFPSQPTTYELVTVTFFGLSLQAGDAVKIIPVALNCSDSSTPLSTMASLSQASYTEILSSGSSGWPVWQTIGSSTTYFNFTSNTSGLFSVCYKLKTDVVWTLVYQTLEVQERNPASVVMTPVSALEGELFTLQFTGRSDLRDSELFLGPNDQVELYLGWIQCLSRRSTDLIATSPSRRDLLPNVSFFQLAAGQRGLHTLCYIHIDQQSGSRVTVWGFPLIPILPNPTSFSTLPVAALRNQYVGLYFVGFGLESNINRTDYVKLVDPGAAGAGTDDGCNTNNQTLLASMGPLTANGNTSIQTVLSSVTGSFFVCYQLHGGRYHVMPSTVTFGLPVPQNANPSKTTPLLDSEQVRWDFVFSGAGWRQGDFIFFSTQFCTEVPVTSSPQSTPLSNFNSASQTLQDPSTLSLYALSLVPSNSGTYSLCYRSPNDYPSGSTSIVVSNIVVMPAYPPRLPNTLFVVAMQIFSFRLEVSPQPGDYIVLVANAGSCVGLVAPAGVERSFIQVVPDAAITPSSPDSGTFVSVVAMVPTAGSYFVCFSHLSGICANGTGRECARVVAAVSASDANPSNWAVTGSAAVYTTSTLVVQLQRSSGSATFTSGDALWLAPLSQQTSGTTFTVADACRACLALAWPAAFPPAGNMSSVQLLFSGGQWSSLVASMGSFSVCFTGSQDVLPHVFVTPQLTIVTVELSRVTSAAVKSIPLLAGLTGTFTLSGFGLSQNDTLFAVPLPSSTTDPQVACTSGSLQNVSAIPSFSGGFGQASIDRSFVFVTSGPYALCFVPAAAPPGQQVALSVLSNIVVGSTVTQVAVTSTAQLTNTPLQLSFFGVSLNAADRAAMVPSGANGGPPAASVCVAAPYSQVSSITNSSSATQLNLIPTQAGTFYTCYQPLYGQLQLLTQGITIGQRLVVSAQFFAAPVCTAGAVCTTQPAAVLLDINGMPAGDVGATVSLRLRSATTSVYEDILLADNSTYSVTSNTYFQYTSVVVGLAGTYTMEAQFTLLGGVYVTAVSQPFVVKGNTTASAMYLQCTRSGAVIPRSSSDPIVQCLITTTSVFAADSYSVSTTPGGTSTTVSRSSSGGSSGLLPSYGFNVTLNFADVTASYVIITARALGPFLGEAIVNSPLTVYIGDVPNTTSVLQCSPLTIDTTLPTTRILRAVSGIVRCTLTGRTATNEIITALPGYFAASLTKYGVPSSTSGTTTTTVTSISLPPTPLDVSSAFVFFVSVPNADNISITAALVPGLGGGSVVGSPQVFEVLKAPTAQSVLQCYSAITSSTTKAMPREVLRCTLYPHDFFGNISGLGTDYGAGGTLGASAGAFGAGAFSTALSFLAYAPANPASTTNQHAFLALDASTDYRFQILADYHPTNTTSIASTSITLVYGTVVSAASKLVAGSETSYLVGGSGLELSDDFVLSTSAACDANVRDVTPQATSTAGVLRLVFQVPSQPFYICFRPNGATQFQLMQSTAIGSNGTLINNVGGGGSTSGLTNDELAVLIVGVILLAILLILLPCVIYKVWYQRGIAPSKYVPRVNDQYVHRPTVPRPGQVATAPPPPAGLSVGSPSSEGNVQLNAAGANGQVGDDEGTAIDGGKKSNKKRNKSGRKAKQAPQVADYPGGGDAGSDDGSLPEYVAPQAPPTGLDADGQVQTSVVQHQFGRVSGLVGATPLIGPATFNYAALGQNRGSSFLPPIQGNSFSPNQPSNNIPVLPTSAGGFPSGDPYTGGSSLQAPAQRTTPFVIAGHTSRQFASDPAIAAAPPPQSFQANGGMSASRRVVPIHDGASLFMPDPSNRM